MKFCYFSCQCSYPVHYRLSIMAQSPATYLLGPLMYLRSEPAFHFLLGHPELPVGTVVLIPYYLMASSLIARVNSMSLF